jgi:cellobiose-specific phosphotransferase system component IIB
MIEPKKVTLRELFHTLGNKHYTCLLGSGMITERLRDILKVQGLPDEAIQQVTQAIERLSKIEKASKEADVYLTEIKAIVYGRLNPDEEKIEAEALEQKLKDDKPKMMF